MPPYNLAVIAQAFQYTGTLEQALGATDKLGMAMATPSFVAGGESQTATHVATHSRRTKKHTYSRRTKRHTKAYTTAPCMVDDVPSDPRYKTWLARRNGCFESNCPHPSYKHEQAGRKHCHCNLHDLLSIDWGVICDARGRSRRQVMNGAIVDEFNRLGAIVSDAGLSTADFRLLISFD
eukprot:7387563-Prymnesium_polylepis.1